MILFFESADVPREASLLLILKWGGELTPSGRKQAEELGKVFRCMYPGGQGNKTNNCRSIEIPRTIFPISLHTLAF